MHNILQPFCLFFFFLLLLFKIYIKETQENNNLKLSSTLAYMERNQAELKSKNVELKTKLDFDQQALTNLNVIVTELSMCVANITCRTAIAACR